ncbi:hypothetical protein [Natronorubrum bangense]|uniref:Uncharacterized protein n=2 Tax=Natronorubrum bangense TaxID=61858 RepID=L9WK34_9EURY|nr:hypothetical protein [Natronorubrum bangense]ELY49850.1 hypothetical protein C494_07565 [Natronorubrum bangense JCM 10635]QCC55471.1 hypothetical protein DV706_13935 [Natronorubrum bangense]
MTRYVRETHCYSGDGFDVDGHIIEVLNHSELRSSVTVLVEKADPQFVVEETAPLPERVSDDTQESPQKLIFFCNAETSDGEQCTREVEECGDRCWQHTLENEE